MFKDDQEDPERVGLMSGLIPPNNRKSPFLGEDLAFPIPNLHLYRYSDDIRMIYGNFFVQDWVLRLLQEHPTSLLRWYPGLRRVLPSGWRENRGERLHARLGSRDAVIFVAQGFPFLEYLTN